MTTRSGTSASNGFLMTAGPIVNTAPNGTHVYRKGGALIHLSQTNTEVVDRNHTSSYNDYIELNADFTNRLGSLKAATDEGRSMSAMILI